MRTKEVEFRQISDTMSELWIDEPLRPLVEKIEGVSHVTKIYGKNHFHIYFDPRYNKAQVMKDIEMFALIAKILQNLVGMLRA